MSYPPGARSVLAADTSPDWRTGGVARKGQQIQFGFNAALRRAADRPAYPIRVEVWLDLFAPVRSAIIDRADLSAVRAADQTLRRLAAGRAIVAAQVTTPGARSYLLYTADATLAQDLDGALRTQVTDHRVHVTAMPDQQWSGYASVVKMARRSRVVLTCLAPFPLLIGAIVGAHYGPGWGIGETVALYGWIAGLAIPVYRARKQYTSWELTTRRPAWLAYHPAWAYAFFAYTMASLCFFFPSLWLYHVVSPWVSLAIGVAAGVAITTAIWPRQLRDYAELRSRAANP
jgi:hypothetical protein